MKIHFARNVTVDIIQAKYQTRNIPKIYLQYFLTSKYKLFLQNKMLFKKPHPNDSCITSIKVCKYIKVWFLVMIILICYVNTKSGTPEICKVLYVRFDN